VRAPARRAVAAVVVALTLLLPEACGGSGAGSGQDSTSALLSKVRVVGAVGALPSLRFDTPVQVAESSWRVVEPGNGPPIQVDQQFMLQLTLVNGRTGRTAISTLDPGQTVKTLRSSDDDLFPVLQKALAGRRQGARILIAAAAKDAYGDVGAPQYGIKPGDPLMMVADVVAVPPTKVLDGPAGSRLKPARGAPLPVERDGEVVRLRFDAQTMSKPKHLVVVPLVEGTGPPARSESLVTIDDLGQLWGTGRVVTSTYGKEPLTFALGTGNVIKAWDRALVGVRRGSRVLVLAPPRLAFQHTGQPPEIPGDATLAYVVDVLGVS
jgi:peptidylprolyl isomerase